MPFGYHSIDPIKKSLEVAGFTDLKVEVLSLKKTVPDARPMHKRSCSATPRWTKYEQAEASIRNGSSRPLLKQYRANSVPIRYASPSGQPCSRLGGDSVRRD